MSEETNVPNNVVPLDPFASKKVMKRIDKRMENHQKVTQQEAFQAMMEMRKGFSEVYKSIQNLAEESYKKSNAIQYVFNHFHVLSKVLVKKGLMTDDDLKEMWEEVVVKPMEEERQKVLKDKITELKDKSAKDATFADAIEKVKAHTFSTEKAENGDEIAPDDVKNFLLAGLVDDATREEVYKEIKERFPELQLADIKLSDTTEPVVVEEQVQEVPVVAESPKQEEPQVVQEQTVVTGL